MAEAYAKSGKTDDAIKTYEMAAQADPTHAAGYYFNEGAVLTNSGKVDPALAAFDKVIAADPNRADAYYWKGVNMIGKATLGQGGKMVAPDGTAEAFQKYLELQPSGTYADAAKQMLASIGASVQTSFGNKKKSTKK
jgi:tetratricopeptide (TPR) repeat protein